jgi:hypothetical protein
MSFSNGGNSSFEPSRETVSPWNIRATAYLASNSPMLPSFLNSGPKRPAQFDRDQITLWDEIDPWVCHNALPATIPNNV